ncbi:MAG: element excision factor XisI family protein [Nostoc sp.]|uniref:element excision factor XisI family protein n=1 Tax=Nostoc sp. TaxID=1180 RepID=UPI002FFC1C26
MDKLAQYRNVIKKILTEYYETTNTQVIKDAGVEVSDRLAFDETRDQYLWFRFGWDDKKQIQYLIIYLCIKNGKVWVEEDATNLCVLEFRDAEFVPSRVTKSRKLSAVHSKCCCVARSLLTEPDA